jgi:ubiquinone/menaquinone biosynthesis C-methylase UbiE
MSASATTPSDPSIRLDQRGRAELEFLAGVRGGLAPLRATIKTTLEESGALDAPFTSIEDLRAATDAALADSVEQRVLGTVLRWSRDQATPRAAAAFDRNSARLEPLAVGGAELVEDRVGETVPRYWDYEFHGTTGGWDGHDHMGFIHHELVYRNIIMAAYGGDIYAIRGMVAAAAPKDNYRHILDMGSGTGQYTMKLAETYPDAEITAVDMSRTAINYAVRRGLNAGHTWRGIRAAAEDTGLDAESMDLVTSFIVLHEVPPHITKKILAEAFRVLAPGGDVHFSDVTPYRERSTYQAWADDWDAENGSEPWWRTAASMNLSELAREAGFVDVVERGLGAGNYPWVLTATKPVASESE